MKKTVQFSNQNSIFEIPMTPTAIKTRKGHIPNKQEVTKHKVNVLKKVASKLNLPYRKTKLLNSIIKIEQRGKRLKTILRENRILLQDLKNKLPSIAAQTPSSSIITQADIDTYLPAITACCDTVVDNRDINPAAFFNYIQLPACVYNTPTVETTTEENIVNNIDISQILRDPAELDLSAFGCEDV